MRFVTYEQGGRRRLGTILDDRVVDLPGLVGHPAFPTSLESLVQRNGGTLMPAARAALERGVYLPPNGYEVGFLSLAHTPEILQTAAKALSEAARAVGSQ